MDGLLTLELNSNSLTNLPSEIGLLTRLKTLNIRDNKLQQIPESIQELKQLKELMLGKKTMLGKMSMSFCPRAQTVQGAHAE